MDKYLKKFKKALKVNSKLKKKIVSDIRADFEMHIANGNTVEQTIKKLGNPKEAAEEFNQNYPEYKVNAKKRILSILTMVFALVSIICLLIGIIGKFAYLENNQISHIGGVDLPTEIFIVSEPISALTIFDGLIKISMIIFAAVILCIVYLLIKFRKKR